MHESRIGLKLDVEVRLKPQAQGGRSTPLVAGYRPLCVFTRNGDKVTIGLCELDMATPLEAGMTGRATLAFDERVALRVRELVRVGTQFELSEGRQVIGSARVLGLRD